MKSAEAGAHKSEIGGIALDLADAEAVRVAVERIGLPVIVQPMVSGGTELLAGSFRTPSSARSSRSGREECSRS